MSDGYVPLAIETVTVWRCPDGHISNVTRFPDFEGVRRCFFCPGCGRKERGGPNDTICRPFNITIPTEDETNEPASQ